MRRIAFRILAAALTVGSLPGSALADADPANLLPSGVTARWGYAGFGPDIGGAGLVLSDGEIITNGVSYTDFPADGYFYILRPAGSGYVQVFVSRPFPDLAALGVADVVGDPRPEIVIAQADGAIALFDQRSREEIAGFNVAAADVTAMALRDLDGDGKAEILLITDDFFSNTFYAVSGAGTLLWQRAAAGGFDLAVGNMDADPSLEIATTSGAVIDASSRTIQWQRTQGFGNDVAVGDIDSDGKDELIAGDGSDLWAFDVDTQLPKWSFPADVDAIWVGNIDADPRLEVLVGDYNWDGITAYDSVTRVEEWTIPAPNSSGVSIIVVGDPNGDGIRDILWGGGANSTGPDRLYVANLATRTIDWENVQLEGPFAPPRWGDLDGDGVPEIVTASFESDAGYDSGRIVVLDGATLRVKGVSPPIVGNFSWEGLRDLELRNVDGDPQMEILIAADDLYDGVIEIYDFAPPGDFTRIWTNLVQPDNTPFYQVDVADVDADGALEVIGTTTRYVYVYSLATRLEEWHSFALNTGWPPVDGLAVLTAGGGVADIVAMVGGETLNLFTGAGQIQAIVPGPFRYIGPDASATGRGFLTGDDDGAVRHYQKQASSYVVAWTRDFGTAAIDGATVLPAGQLALTSSGRLTLFSQRDAPTPLWTSEDYGIKGSTMVGAGATHRPFAAGDYGVFSLAPWRTLLSVSPPAGPFQGGTLLTATGTAFDPGSRMFVGGQETLGTQVPDGTHVTGTTPPLVVCSVNDVTVVNPDMSYETLDGAFRASCGGCATVTVNPATIPAATSGVAYSQAFTQTGGTGAISWSLAGALPPGISFSPAGLLSGVPTQTGSFPITVHAVDANGCTGSRAYTLVVNCAVLTIRPVALPTVTPGTPYSQTFTTTNGSGVIGWSLTGVLPAGLAFTSSPVVLSGTTTQTGLFPITVDGIDANGCAGNRAYTLVVDRANPFVPLTLAVDAAGNAVLEPGENAVVAPTWRNDTGAPDTVTGAASAFSGDGSSTYTITDGASGYGTVPAGALATCSATGDCYVLGVSVPNPRPAVHWDASFLETLSSSDAKPWTLHVGNSFTDVPSTSGFYRFIETILHKNVTSGCSATAYCPASPTTRDQMAVFVLVSREPAGYVPPACGATPMFTDVPVTSGFCRWIEELARRNVVGGCGGSNYCPTAPATREQMAVFVLRTLDPALQPPACTTPMFSDVPASSGFCRWIEELARRGVVTGCGAGRYCPTSPVSREQMGVFLSVTFGLTLYGS